MSNTLDTTSKLSGGNSCKLVVTQATGTDWHLQYYQNIELKAGFTYTLTYTAAADRNTSIVAAMRNAQTANLTTSPQTFTANFVAPSDENTTLAFWLAGSAPRTIWIDDVSVIETSNDPDPQNCSEVHSLGYGLMSDFMGNCYNDLGDFALLASYWLQTGCADGVDCDIVDLVNDNTIDILDLNNWAASLGVCNDPQNQNCVPTW